MAAPRHHGVGDVCSKCNRNGCCAIACVTSGNRIAGHSRYCSTEQRKAAWYLDNVVASSGYLVLAIRNSRIDRNWKSTYRDERTTCNARARIVADALCAVIVCQVVQCVFAALGCVIGNSESVAGTDGELVKFHSVRY